MVRKREKDDLVFYEDLCNKYFEKIYLYCKRMVRGQEQFTDFVEECTQNTFLEARKQVSKLRKHPNVEGWLYTTARNLINQSYRGMYIKNKYEVILEESFSATMDVFEHNLEEIFNSEEDLDKLYADVLEQLNENEYSLYTDYYKLKMSIPELAIKYEVSYTAITTRIYRLKKKIKNLVSDRFKEG